MARIRTIKPEFFSSPDLKVCRDPYERLLYIAMWNWADDHGRGIANIRELGGFAFPLDEQITSADIRRMLGGIHRAFGVEFYVVDGREYYYIPSWTDHQKIDHRSNGKYPSPDQGDPYDPDPDHPCDQHVPCSHRVHTEGSGNPAELPSSPRRDDGVGTGEQGNRGTGEQGNNSSTGKPAVGDDFEAFWTAYPRKVGKPEARKKWNSALKKAKAEVIMAALAKYAFNRDPQFIPHPATWLNQERWNDTANVTQLRPAARQHEWE